MTDAVQAFRLSHQQRLFLEADDRTPARCTVTIGEPVDQQRLAAAVREAVRRHEALRTVLGHIPGAAEPVQHLLPLDQAVTWGPGDLDPENGPLLRARLADDGATLLLETFARNADPVSLAVVVADVARHYSGGAEPETPVQYAQYASWQQDCDSDPGMAGRRPATADRWPDLRLPYVLSTDATTGPATTAEEEHPVDLSSGLGDALAGVPAGDLEPLLLAAWCALLARLGDTRLVAVATLSAGRDDPDLVDAVGPYARYLPVQVAVTPDTSAADLVARVTAELANHQEPAALESGPPDPTAAFAVIGADSGPREGSFRITERSVPSAGAEVALLADSDSDTGHGTGGVRLRVRCRAGRFWPGTGPTLADQYAAVLARVLAAPCEPVLATDLYTPRAARLIDGANDTATEAAPLSFSAQWDSAVEQYAHRTAVTEGERTLTYAELDTAARGLAAHLVDRGARSGSVVALGLERGCDAVIAILAVTRAGATWLPLDLRWPTARLRRVLREAAADLLVTRDETGIGKRVGSTVPIVPVDAEGAAAAAPQRHPDDLAYLMYTSGSTGVPKGVAVTDRGLGNYLAWSQEAYRITPDTVSLVHSPLTFDLTLTSLLTPLTAGATVRFPGSPGIDGLLRGLAAADTTLLKITPAHLRLLQAVVRPADAAALRTVIIGGEALTEEHLRPWRSLAPQAALVNEYGPTETTVGCCVWRDDGAARRAAVPIGRPIAGTRLLLLDPAGRPVGIGVPGELHIGGAGVARGYHRQPALTAQRFVADPSRPGGRLYRTGDIARYLPTGDLEYLGRNDDQVQVQGYRVELGEIESVLARHPDVQVAAAAVRSDPATVHGYAVAVAGAAPDPGELRSFLSDRLPAYLVPATVTVLPELPVTAQGKLDRARLPAASTPDRDTRPERTDTTFQAPRGSTETRISAIWAATLGIDRVGVDDNFFDLGGHSFLLIELTGRLQQEFGPDVTVLTVVENPTVARLTATLSPRSTPTAGPPDAGLDDAADRARLRRRAQSGARRRNEVSHD